MKCVICRTGDLAPGLATVKAQRGATLIIVKEVPADICQTCGEYYLNEPVATKVYALAEEAIKRQAEVENIQYAA